jgi:DNA-binding transcriptional regulator YdaS (Cro superfamily)
MNGTQLVGLLLRECKAIGDQAAWAAKHGISASYVSNVLQFRRDPGPAILAALGVERVVSYKRVNGKGKS